MTVRFTQSCPTCGRRIQVRAALLGRTIACQHCHAEFVAQNDVAVDSTGDDLEQIEPLDPLMARVEEALERARVESKESVA